MERCEYGKMKHKEFLFKKEGKEKVLEKVIEWINKQKFNNYCFK